MNEPWGGFASDNYSGVHPQVLEAIVRANAGYAVAYGDDGVSARLAALVREHFGPRARMFPVFNGTGANVVALEALCRRWEAVVCAQTAHVHCDEGGAPEKMGGLKLLTVPTPDGLLTPELIATQAWGFGDVHRAQPAAVSVTQSSELGTAYTVEQLAAIADFARARGMKVHLDGARIANAAAATGASLRELTVDVGIDAVSFGGTKNGAMGAEAVVVFDDELAAALAYVRKTSMQLASKMRFISAQLEALLTDGLWLANARHANAMARRLEAAVREIPGVRVTQRVDANAVFAILPAEVTQRLQQAWRFYTWNEATGEVRWMCAWDTAAADVDAFADAIAAGMRG